MDERVRKWLPIISSCTGLLGEIVIFYRSEFQGVPVNEALVLMMAGLLTGGVLNGQLPGSKPPDPKPPS